MGMWFKLCGVMLDELIKELHLCNKSPRFTVTNSPNCCPAIMWKKKMTRDRNCTVATLRTWRYSIEPGGRNQIQICPKERGKALRQIDGIFKIMMKPASGKIVDREVRQENKYPLTWWVSESRYNVMSPECTVDLRGATKIPPTPPKKSLAPRVAKKNKRDYH